MRLTALVMSLLAFAPARVFALPSYTGTFTDPDQVLEITFAVVSSQAVLIQTYGYGGTANALGGTNGSGAVITPGGFNPYLSLFLGTGPSATFLTSNDDGTCAAGFGTANLGNCFDSTLSFFASAAETFTLALTQPNNFSIAENYGIGTIGDGFIGLAGDFIDSAGNQRSGAYAVDILFGSPSALPETDSLALLGPALAWLPVIRSRRRHVG